MAAKSTLQTNSESSVIAAEKCSRAHGHDETQPIAEIRPNIFENERFLSRWSTSIAKVLDTGIFRADAAGAWKYVNDSLCRLIGVPGSRMLGRGWMESVHPDDLQAVRYAWDRFVDKTASFTLEFRFRRSNGEDAWVIARAMAEDQGNGRRTGHIGIITDISDRKRSEESLRLALESSRKYQRELTALVDSARAVLEQHSFLETAQTILQSCKTLIGAAAGYIALSSLDRTENKVLFLDSGGAVCTVDPELPMPIRGLREEVFRTGNAVFCNNFSETEFVRYMPPGHMHLTNVLFAPLKVRGSVVGLFGIANKPGGFTDEDARIASMFSEIAAIALVNARMEEERDKLMKSLEHRVRERTADLIELNSQLQQEMDKRNLAERVSRQERRKLKNILDCMGDGVYVVDRNCDLLYVNPATEKQFGTMNGRKCFDYFHAFSAPCAWCKGPEALADNYEHWEFNSAKTNKIYEVFNTPYTNEDGTMAKLGILRDITERKKAEDSLQNALSEIRQLKERLEAENLYFQKEIKMSGRFDQIVGQSNALKYVLYRAEQVAPTETTVLVLGESGTGKNVLVNAIHRMSPRRERPLVTVNCAALPSNLIESELFGRERGAYTGSDARQIGRFEIADGSTLCLDEIAELPLAVQAKLLRVLQEHEFERLGSSRTIRSNARIIATTNRNLEKEVREGKFREDLFYRLNVFPLTVPPLRKRKEDIPALVQVITERHSRKIGKHFRGISRETLEALQSYDWPGNIRELENVIERGVILCPGPMLHLTDNLECAPVPAMISPQTLEEIERHQIMRTLQQTNWRINGPHGAAAILDLPPSTLRSKMHKLGIHRPTNEN